MNRKPCICRDPGSGWITVSCPTHLPDGVDDYDPRLERMARMAESSRETRAIVERERARQEARPNRQGKRRVA